MKQITYRCLNRFLSIFYDRKYLQGRFFESSKGGYVWAFRGILYQKILGFNRKAPYPVSHFISLSNPENLEFHPDNLDNLQTPGVYFQNLHGKIKIGRGSFIAPNVGLITQNHDSSNLEKHLPAQDIIIGEKCWIGMNAVIMPGVILGDSTIVGAGTIVTKSFADGQVRRLRRRQ